jgi:hypothetical protein
MCYKWNVGRIRLVATQLSDNFKGEHKRILNCELNIGWIRQVAI